MTPLDASICWAVLAPLPTAQLEQVAARAWADQFPSALDPPPWESLAGSAGYNALVSRLPGTEGSDRHFAAILSRLSASPVFALWLDPERRQAFEWKDGDEVATPAASLDAIAARLGFSVATEALPPRAIASVAVVEGASGGEVRRVLGEFADAPWLHVSPGPAGVVVRATGGPLGTQAWDLAEALPSATVYYLQQWPDAFEVLVLRGTEEVGEFRVPPRDDGAGALPDIKGEMDPPEILRVLGVPPEALRPGK